MDFLNKTIAFSNIVIRL